MLQTPDLLNAGQEADLGINELVSHLSDFIQGHPSLGQEWLTEGLLSGVLQNGSSFRRRDVQLVRARSPGSPELISFLLAAHIRANKLHQIAELCSLFVFVVFCFVFCGMKKCFVFFCATNLQKLQELVT